MNLKHSATIILLTLVIAACSGQTPQATPLPATATEVILEPTETQPPSTDTSVPATEAAGAATDAPQPAGDVSFSRDVFPILEASCTKCHGAEQIKEGLDLTTYDGIMRGSFNGPVITAGNAADSYLVQQILEGEMPKRGPGLTDEQIKIIADWVNQGAINN